MLTFAVDIECSKRLIKIIRLSGPRKAHIKRLRKGSTECVVLSHFIRMSLTRYAFCINRGRLEIRSAQGRILASCREGSVDEMYGKMFLVFSCSSLLLVHSTICVLRSFCVMLFIYREKDHIRILRGCDGVSYVQPARLISVVQKRDRSSQLP